MPESSVREVWSVRGDDLPQITFHPPIVEDDREDLPELAEEWLQGQSAAVERLRARAISVAREGSAVTLVHGEPGSGKFRTAQWIHRCGSRASRPLLVVDADDPGIDRQLQHVIDRLRDPSSAPGTVVVRRLERAGVGTIQHLLALLGSQAVELVCAVVLLSREAPEQLRARSSAHEQLIARAGSTTVPVPALRLRSGDVPELARHFAQEAADRYGKSLRGVSPQALSKLDGHEFPGNVRELQAMVEQAVLRSSGDWVTAESFHSLGEQGSVRTTDSAELVIRMPGSSLREIEIQALRLALRLSGGRIVRASELLGITRHALRRKLEKFGLGDLRAE